MKSVQICFPMVFQGDTREIHDSPKRCKTSRKYTSITIWKGLQMSLLLIFRLIFKHFEVIANLLPEGVPGRGDTREIHDSQKVAKPHGNQ